MSGKRFILLWVVPVVAAVAAAWALADVPAADPLGAEPGERLEGLILDRPDVPLTQSKVAPKVKKPLTLPPDGSMTFDRLCRIRADASIGWVILEFPDEPGKDPEPSRWALPCERLEKMEAVAAKTPGVLFRISGENFVYNGKSFLLVSREPVISSPRTDRQTGKEAAAKDATPTVSRDPADKPASRPATLPAGARKGEPSADDIFRELMREKPGRPIDPGTYKPHQPYVAPSVAPKPREPDAIEGATIVSDRIATIPPAQGDSWRELRFRGDNTLREPPLRLLPCAMLQHAETLGGPLRVSGLVTSYKGRKYLLLRKAMHERDMDQF